MRRVLAGRFQVREPEYREDLFTEIRENLGHIDLDVTEGCVG